MSQSRTVTPEDRIAGWGEMTSLIRAHDWSTTALGPIAAWPEQLVGSVNLMLACAFPCLIFWGPEMVQFYNDAFRPLLHERHPVALGQTARVFWQDAWPVIGTQLEAVLASGHTVSHQKVLVPIIREGRLQDVWWNYSYSPVFAPDGSVAGILVVCQDVTGELLSLRNLQASEERASRILESIGDAVIVTDGEAHVTRMNPVAEALTGWTAEEAAGRPLKEVFRIVHETTNAPLESPAEIVKREGTVIALSNHTLLVRRDGSKVPLDDTAAPIRDPEGNLTGIVVVFRSTAERRQAARALQQSEERLRLALNAAGIIGIWDWDLPNDRVYADAAFARFYGEDPDRAAAGLPSAEFRRHIHPDDAARVQQALRRSLDECGDLSCEYRIIQPGGNVRWLSASGRCTCEGGTALRFLGVAVDISERKSTEEALRESEARLSSIYSASLEYIGILSADGKIVDLNRASLEFAGNTREELLGMNFWETPWFASTPGAPEQVRQAIAQAAAGKSYSAELALARPSGEVISFDFSLTPVFDSNGKVIFIVPEGRDLRDLKRARQALMESEKIAAVGRLASSIAHEINNPLEAVTNLLYLARQKAEVEQVQEYLLAADHELRRVSAIANQTLRFHKQASNPETVDVTDLFSTVLSIYEGRLKNSRISVEIRHRVREPVTCFAGDTRQVLNNLVGNAIDAMAGPGGRLLIRSHMAHEWTSGRRGVVFTVADSGHGMSRETRSHIFEPFFTTKGMAGTGLGLWVSQEVVQRHHGFLRVRSSQTAQCHGTVFRFFLPLVQEPEPEPQLLDLLGS